MWHSKVVRGCRWNRVYMENWGRKGEVRRGRVWVG